QRSSVRTVMPHRGQSFFENHGEAREKCRHSRARPRVCRGFRSVGQGPGAPARAKTSCYSRCASPMLRQASETVAKRAGAAPLPAASPVLAPPETTSLEQELASAEGGRAWLRKLGLWALVLGLAGGGVAWRIKTRAPAQPRYVVAAVSQGDVVESVQSTGTVQPLTQVQVGAQISGRIAKVY